MSTEIGLHRWRYKNKTLPKIVKKNLHNLKKKIITDYYKIQEPNLTLEALKLRQQNSMFIALTKEYLTSDLTPVFHGCHNDFHHNYNEFARVQSAENLNVADGGYCSADKRYSLDPLFKKFQEMSMIIPKSVHYKHLIVPSYARTMSRSTKC